MQRHTWEILCYSIPSISGELSRSSSRLDISLLFRWSLKYKKAADVPSIVSELLLL